MNTMKPGICGSELMAIFFFFRNNNNYNMYYNSNSNSNNDGESAEVHPLNIQYIMIFFSVSWQLNNFIITAFSQFIKIQM